jgi:hypothetical protein
MDGKDEGAEKQHGNSKAPQLEPYQFTKGQSGNPKGRPKKQRTFNDVVEKIGKLKLLEAQMEKIPEEYRKAVKTIEDAFAFALYMGGAKLNPTAVRMLSDLQAKKIVVAGDEDHPLNVQGIAVRFVKPGDLSVPPESSSTGEGVLQVTK